MLFGLRFNEHLLDEVNLVDVEGELLARVLDEGTDSIDYLVDTLLGGHYYTDELLNEVILFKNGGSMKGFFRLRVTEVLEKRFRKVYDTYVKIVTKYLKGILKGNNFTVEDVCFYYSVKREEGLVTQVSVRMETDEYLEVCINDSLTSLEVSKETGRVLSCVPLKEKDVKSLRLKFNQINAFCRKLYYIEYPVSEVHFFKRNIEGVKAGLARETFMRYKYAEGKVLSPLVCDDEDTEFQLSIIL